MTQREVTDKDGTRWACVQAFAGLEGKAAEKATELSEDEEGKVKVVCTPSGGAQTVRLTLNEDWLEMLQDEDLVLAIQEQTN
jgi:hypothetical protein